MHSMRTRDKNPYSNRQLTGAAAYHAAIH